MQLKHVRICASLERAMTTNFNVFTCCLSKIMPFLVCALMGFFLNLFFYLPCTLLKYINMYMMQSTGLVTRLKSKVKSKTEEY